MNAADLADINRGLPVVVRAIEVEDVLVTLSGPDWSLSLACPWDLITPHGVISWDSSELEDTAWDLVGSELSSVREESGEPVFEFGAGYAVAIHADTDVDPWVLHLGGLIIVGQATAPEGE